MASKSAIGVNGVPQGLAAGRGLPGQRLLASAQSYIVPAFLFALAAYLRFDRLWLVEFKRDEAVLADRALSFVEGRYLPLAGNPSGAGVLNPPGFVYLTSIPLRVWPHPVAGSAFYALLGALAVVACYYLGRRYFGPAAGLAGALLYAVNPWAIWYTRHIWEPDSIQLFVVLFFLALYAFVVDGSGRALALSVIALAFLTQLHFSTVVLAPVWLLGLALGRRRLSWRPLAAGIAVSLAIYAPYLYGDATHGWTNVRALFVQRIVEARVDLHALYLVRELVGGFGYFLPDDLAGSGPLAGLRLALLRRGEEALCLVGLASALWLAIRGMPRRRSAYLLLLAWVAFPVILTLRHWMNLYVHYFVTMLPALALVSGVGAAAIPQALGRALEAVEAPTGPGPLAAFRAREVGTPPRSGLARLLSSRRGKTVRGASVPPDVVAGRRTGRRMRRLAVSAVAAALGLAVLAVSYSQVFAARSLMDHAACGDRARYLYGVPLIYTTALADYLAAQGFAEIRVVAPSDDLAEALNTLLRRRAAITRFDGRLALPLPPPGGAAYVVVEDDSPAVRLLTRTSGDRRIRRFEEHGKPLYSVYRLPGGMADALLGSEFAPSALQFEHGLRLLGTRVPRSARAGEAVEVAALWRVERQPVAGPDFFVAWAHLVDPENRELAAAHDYAHLPSTVDIGGDWVSWLTMTAPDSLPFSIAWVDYGVYRSPGVRPVAIADGAGWPVGTQVRLGPLKAASAAAPTPAPEHLRQARFGSGIVLRGYDLDRPEPGQLRVTLHWQALGTPGADYQVFVHLVDAAGRLVAQHDSPPGGVPTSLWDVGDEIADPHPITLPVGPAAGTYRLLAGLYLLSDGSRLPVVDGFGGPPADAVVLAEVSLP